MTGAALALRTGNNGLLQPSQNGMLQTVFTVRKPSKTSISGSKEKENFLPLVRRYLGRKNVAMLVLFALALLAFLMGFITSSKEEALEDTSLYPGRKIEVLLPPVRSTIKVCGQNYIQPPLLNSSASTLVTGTASLLEDPCKHFISPPVPPGGSKQIGPRPCPVCYVPVEHARARMPSSPSTSPVLRNLTYFQEDNPTKTEPHGGSEFGGYPSLKQRNDSFDIKESMSVHCGFIKGCTPGYQTGFDIDEADILELTQPHDIIVASAIFGNYDVIQQPKHISAFSRNKVSFYMFIDEETEAFMKNTSILGSSKRVGLWRIIVVHNVPYSDPRRNGKVPKLLLHRLFPNVRYSIWIDGKLQLVADPYQILERFLWRQNATFAISRHYRRFDVFVEAEANKAAGKYDNSSINDQIEFYKKEGLTSYSEAKLPITSDVPEGCVIIKEHIPITNLFTCLWFNEVDRFTSRDQLSFSTVRDKVMAKVDWSINMFMDCERRNFVIQAYHRGILEQMAPPADTNTSFHLPILDKINHAVERSQVRQIPAKRGRRSGSRRHRKVVTGNRGKF